MNVTSISHAANLVKTRWKRWGSLAENRAPSEVHFTPAASRRRKVLSVLAGHSLSFCSSIRIEQNSLHIEQASSSLDGLASWYSCALSGSMEAAIGEDVQIGNNVTINSGAVIPDGASVG